MQTYHQYLDADPGRAMLEGSMHFENASKVHQTLRRITGKLDDLKIPYVIAGAMALFYHGYRRFTEAVDLIVTREDLKRIHEELEGLGYMPVFKGGKALRDTTTGVKIDFMISGDYPGDGKPKPVAFPASSGEAEVIQGMRFAKLFKIMELKLASGLSDPMRAKDLGDVQEVIKTLRPGDGIGMEMDSSVRDEYLKYVRVIEAQPPEDY